MIIFIYGQDHFRSGRKVQEIKARFLKSSPTGSGLSEIEFSKGEGSGWAKIGQELRSPGLFFSKQLIIARNFIGTSLSSERGNALEELEKNEGLQQDQERVLLFWEESQPKGKDKLVAFLEKNSKKQRFDALNGLGLTKWIKEETFRVNPQASLSAAALEKLILAAGSDMFRLAHEIEKLANYQVSGEISGETVDLLVCSEADPNIFETVEALSRKDRSRALRLLHEQFEKGADPFYLLSMYAYQLRNLLKVGDFFEAGERNIQAIARGSGLHPFVVQKAVQELRGIEGGWLQSAYSRLSEADYQIKRGMIDPILALDRFIAES